MLKKLLVAVIVLSLGVLILLTFNSVAKLTSGSPKITPEVTRGKQAWQDNNCINCHTILGNGAYFAPDLTKVAKRRDRDWLKSFLSNPVKIWPGTSMQNVKISPQEATDLADFLIWVNGMDTNGWPPKPLKATSSNSNSQKEDNSGTPNTNHGEGDLIARGEAVYEAQGCSTCHQVNGIGGKIGPMLNSIGKTRDKVWLNNFLSDPQAVKPGAAMLRPKLSQDDLKALVEYLVNLK
jgi:nitric oxide reductase subunit C